MLLEEDRGSERQRSGYGGVSERGVEGRYVECMCTEEFGDGVGEGWDGERRERWARGSRGGAQRRERAAVRVRGTGAGARACSRDQQLRRCMDRVGGVANAARAGRHGGT